MEQVGIDSTKEEKNSFVHKIMTTFSSIYPYFPIFIDLVLTKVIAINMSYSNEVFCSKNKNIAKLGERDHLNP